VALRESEERRALAEHAGSDLQPERRGVLYASPSFTELMGYPREAYAAAPPT
jgi:hypothetical protein